MVLRLRNLRDWEKVELVIMRHWIVYILLWIYIFLWIGIIIAIYAILWFNALTNIINIMFSLVFVLFLYVSWLNHELDMYIITNNRIIWVEQISFLNRTVSECNLSQVQEVNSRTKWFFANIFNYWTLSIQTAWNKTTLEMDFCPDAMQKAREVLNVVDKYWESISDKQEEHVEECAEG